MNINPSADWNQLNDRYYRKKELYSMCWKDVDLFKSILCGAPHGGPLAITRDAKKVLVVGPGSLRPDIHIYASSGKLLTTLSWDKSKIVGMGWVDNDRLLCVIEDGTVILLNPFGKEVLRFDLGREAREQGVLDCKIWSSGLVCITQKFKLISISNLSDCKPRVMADPGITEAPKAWCVIEPIYASSLNAEVLLATGSTVLAVDGSSVQDQLVTNGPFVRMSVSPDGKLLACFTESGVLWVILSNFSKNISQFDTKSKVAPDQIAWCGTDSVVLYWDKLKLLLMVGPFGDWIKYTYESSVYLIPECDGVRIISNDKCEFLQRVPDVTESVFKIGSTSPAAILYDAYDHFEKKSPKADENIRSIKGELVEAVDACIAAAANETSYSLQRTLLKAASFGKCFLEFYDSTKFVEMCKTVRILNAVNYYEVGVPVTYKQYKELTPLGLIDRLTAMHHHLLACRICEYLKLRKDRVLVDWACVKVTASLPDNEILNSIVEKLSNVPGISYAAIASTAYKNGKIELATRLLDYEPRAADQVPLLISMKQDELALSKAIESGDTDLVYLVVLHIRRSTPPQEFLRLLRNKRVALNLLITYCKQQDLKLLKEIYYGLEQPDQLAAINVLEAYKEDDIDRRISRLQEAMTYYSNSKDSFSSKATSDEIRLVHIQRDLEASVEGQFVGLSLGETLFQLIILGQSKRASKLRSDFGVPDKRWWWIKIKAFAAVKDWPALEKFSKEKKSPIGYAPFADVCIDANNLVEAQKYIARIAEPQLRAEYYAVTGNYQEAVTTAMSSKDPNILLAVRSKFAGNGKALQYIDQAISQLQV